MNILVTGASGFVGSAVWRYFQTQAIPVRPVFRNTDSARLVGVAPEQSAIKHEFVIVGVTLQIRSQR